MNIIFAMGKMRLTLTTILFWVILVLTCFLTENVPYITNNGSSTGFTRDSFAMLTVLIILLLIGYFVLEHKYNKMKIDRILLPVITIFMISNIIGIWANPENLEIYSLFTDETVILNISNQAKFYYSIEIVIMFVVLYALLFCYSRSLIRASRLNVLLLLFIFFNIFATVYSFITEADELADLFTNGFNNANVFINSLFYNKNIYAFSLLIGICSCIALNIRRATWWNYFLIVYFFLCMLLTVCTTTVLICSALIPLYFIAEIVRGYFKRRFVLSTFMLSLIVVVAIFLLIFIAICVDRKIEPMYSALKFLRNNFIYEDFDTFNRRNLDWEFGITQVNNPMALIFGHGLGITTQIFSVGTHGFIRSAHSGYLEILMSQGIMGAVFHASLMLYFVYCIIRLFIKRKTKFALYHLVLMMCIAAHASMESTYIFTTHVNSLLVMFVVYIPVVTAYKHIKHPEICEEVKNAPVWNDAVKPQIITKFVAMVHILLLGAMLLLLVNPLYESNETYYLMVNFGFIFVGISMIFTPHLISTWVSVGSPYEVHRRFKFNSFLIVAIVGGMSMLIYIASENNLLGFLIGLCFSEALVLLAETLIYSITLESGFSSWFKNTLSGIFVLPHYAGVATLAVGALGYLIMQQFVEIDILITVIYMLWVIGIFFTLWYVSPFKMTRDVLNALNQEKLFRFKREVIISSI